MPGRAWSQVSTGSMTGAWRPVCPLVSHSAFTGHRAAERLLVQLRTPAPGSFVIAGDRLPVIVAEAIVSRIGRQPDEILGRLKVLRLIRRGQAVSEMLAGSAVVVGAFDGEPVH